MSLAGSRLRVYFGERGRGREEPLARELIATFADQGVDSAILLRGSEGFGPRHGLQTSSRLTLSEDLPMLAEAVAPHEVISAVADTATEFVNEGLITVEGIRLSGGRYSEDRPQPASAPERSGVRVETGWPCVEMRVWLNRHARINGESAHLKVTGILRDHSADAAIALLGIDGLAAGRRRRAGFFSANREVPMLVTAVGSGGSIGTAWDEIRNLLPDVFAEFSEVTPTPAAPGEVRSGEDEAGGRSRLTVYSGGLEPGKGVEQQELIVRHLRRAGASGATALEGLFGFVGDQPPHGETFWALRRRIPVVTEVIDTRERCLRWLDEIEAVTGGEAVVTSKSVFCVSRPGDPA